MKCWLGKIRIALATLVIIGIGAVGLPSTADAALVNITNPGFEDGFNGWNDDDPSAISNDARSGGRSAKVQGRGGKVSQTVSVARNTDYVFDGYVLGQGVIGVSVGGSDQTASGGGDNDFEKVSVRFNSGSSTRVEIFAAYGGDEGRFDDFALNSSGSNNTGSCGRVSPRSASDNGTNDGNGPAGAIDGDLSPSSRWSSKGASKAIVLDMGSRINVESLAIKWFKGDSRRAFFSVATSNDRSNWTQVLTNAISSGSSSGVETFGLSRSTRARFVRITSNGNSSGNGWNSIVEASVSTCAASVAPIPVTPIPVTPVQPVIGRDSFDMRYWDAEGADPRTGDTMVFDALRERFVTPNGNGWRHELKIAQDQRVGMTEAYEDFSATIKADLSSGSKTIVAQHHASDLGTIVKLYIADSSERNLIDSRPDNGIFDVYVRLAREDGSGETVKTLGTIRSGDSFNFRVLNDRGRVTVTSLGETITLRVENSSASYLKFGNYLQAQDPYTGDNVDDSDDWPEFYRDVGITTSRLTFSNVTHTRRVN